MSGLDGFRRFIRILGNTDATEIGNTLDALRVNLRDASGSEIGSNANPFTITSLPSTNNFLYFGDITTSSTAEVFVQRTTYLEQVTNAQRSFLSSSALDSGAGTGARTISFIYFNSTGAGPFTETLTLNGITAVNTVNTDICFVDSIQAVTAGSGGVNAGIITMKAGVAGGGVTIGTIAATNRQTYWAHKYIPTGKTGFLTGVSVSHNGTTVGSGGLFVIRSRPIGVVDAVEVQVGDFQRLYGQSSTITRSFISSLKVVGPARLRSYVTPETSSTTVYRASVDLNFL